MRAPAEASRPVIAELEVVAGRHRGACVRLAAGDAVVLGSGADADLMLRDRHVADRHVRVGHDRRGLYAEWLEAERVSPEDAERGACGVLLPVDGDELAVGDCRLRVRRGGAPTAASDGGNAAGATEARAAARPRRGAVSLHGHRTTLMSFAAASFAVGALLVAGKGGAPAIDDEAGLAKLLSEPRFAALQHHEVEGETVITGFLASGGEALAFESALAGLDGRFRNRVLVAERLETRIADVLRVNGIEGEVRVPDAGRMEVDTVGVGASVWKRALAAVRRDVPRVRRWTVEHRDTPRPEPGAASAPRPAPTTQGSLDPRTTLAMVIGGDNAHVVTRDNARYFLGSMLPSGHRIVSIEDGQVSLRKDDRITRLDF